MLPDGRCLRNRNAQVRVSMAVGFQERGVARSVGAELASQVFALLIGLDMQRRLDPAAVSDKAAMAGLNALYDAAPERAGQL